MIRTELGQHWRRRTIVFCVLGLLIAGIIAVLVSRLVTDSSAEFDQAIEIADENPVEGERYFERQLANLTSNPTNAKVALAWLRARREEWEDAESLIDGLDLSEARSDLLFRLARTAERFDMLALTIRVLAPVRSRTGPDQMKALEITWSAYSRLGDFEAAYPVGRKLIELDPKNFSRRLELIRAMQSLNFAVDCLREIDDAMIMDPPDSIRFALEFSQLEVLIEMGRNQDAWNLVARIEKQFGVSIRLKTKIVDLLRLEGRFDEAIKLADEIISQGSQPPGAYVSRATILIELMRYSEAISDLEFAISLEPYNERALFKLSEAYRNSGNQEMAGKFRDRGTDIRNKRSRINDLLKMQSSADFDRNHCEELARLNQDVGVTRMAAYWQHRARKFSKGNR